MMEHGTGSMEHGAESQSHHVIIWSGSRTNVM